MICSIERRRQRRYTGTYTITRCETTRMTEVGKTCMPSPRTRKPVTGVEGSLKIHKAFVALGPGGYWVLWHRDEISQSTLSPGLLVRG